ncbi:putative nucleosomal histone kinase 1 [Operophtera brumata]|uniref:Putative nucleosomal histone kinase 1 n=1 Tax=Operophtera brumata TaxID=104452 RepID=A0A0L7LGS9_OPEBR|nr:putative nucleosomal histone kinase 1 [Operophtera brumata]
MKPKDTPDFAKCQTLFQNYLKSEGKTKNSKMEFALSKKTKTKRGVVDSAENVAAPKVRKGRKPKVKKSDDEKEQSDNDINGKQNGNLPSVVDLAKSDDEEQSSDEEKLSSIKKRKSSEPAALIKVKRTKLTPKVTPPTKKNHANIATQTSTERRKSLRTMHVEKRQVSFDSPVCEVIIDKKPKNNSDSSPDIFEDSFVEQKKPKRKLLSVEKVSVRRVVSKKTTVVKPAKEKSWKDCPTIMNGRGCQ